MSTKYEVSTKYDIFWYSDHENLLRLGRHGVEVGWSAQELLHFFEKPWNYDEEWRAMLLADAEEEEVRAKPYHGALTEPKRCPRCEGWIPNNLTPGAYTGALSRRDNETEICSACGQAEALEDVGLLTPKVEISDWPVPPHVPLEERV